MEVHESAKPRKPSQTELRNEFLSAPPEAILSRRVVAAGLNRSVGWLELRATKGDGPPFLKVGNHRVSYVKRDVEGWWAKYATRIATTSEIPVVQRGGKPARTSPFAPTDASKPEAA